MTDTIDPLRARAGSPESLAGERPACRSCIAEECYNCRRGELNFFGTNLIGCGCAAEQHGDLGPFAGKIYPA